MENLTNSNQARNWDLQSAIQKHVDKLRLRKWTLAAVRKYDGHWILNRNLLSVTFWTVQFSTWHQKVQKKGPLFSNFLKYVMVINKKNC